MSPNMDELQSKVRSQAWEFKLVWFYRMMSSKEANDQKARNISNCLVMGGGVKGGGCDPDWVTVIVIQLDKSARTHEN